MHSIILVDKNRKRLKKISKNGNERYLIQNSEKYPYLSELSNCSYDVFGSTDAPAIIKELLTLKDEIVGEEDNEHIDEIILLLEECIQKKNITIVFTPFE